MKRIKRSQAFMLLAVGILLIVIFGGDLGLFSIGQRSSTTISGDWENWRLSHDSIDYPERNYETYANAGTASTALLKYRVPNELANHSGDIGQFDLYYSSYEVNNNPFYLIVSCGANEIFEDSTPRETPNNVSILIPGSCVYYDTVNENYKVNLHISTRAIRLYNEMVNYWECVQGQTKCVGKNYYTCQNNFFVNNGITLGECGVECIEPEKCEGTEYFVCSNYIWNSQGEVDGKCGYSTPIDCIMGQTKCEGDTFYTCSNNEWVNNGRVDGECGYYEGDNGGSESENSLNKVIYTIGDFQIKLWMLLLLIGVIVVLVIIK